jgi:hypothetical protein
VTSDETTASRKNGNTDGIEAYRGGGLRASPREEVRERIRTFISLGDKQGWDAYNDEPDDDDDDDDKGYDYEWTPELLAIAAEYGQEQALAKLFALAAKTDTAPPSGPRASLVGTHTRRRGSSSRRSRRFSGSTGRNCR